MRGTSARTPHLEGLLLRERRRPLARRRIQEAVSNNAALNQAHWYGRTALKQGMRCEFDDNWQFKARMKLFA
uniref:Uncharacterized protein n=1 Tax=Setaria viridis TaxID=4556 RepID=A0A4V6D685_SETVI|nr:hypothetical protein SEVIR_5G075300v2 [Setaria viridis]